MSPKFLYIFGKREVAWNSKVVIDDDEGAL